MIIKIIRQSFSIVNKLKDKERLKTGFKVPLMSSHEYMDFVGTEKY